MISHYRFPNIREAVFAFFHALTLPKDRFYDMLFMRNIKK